MPLTCARARRAPEEGVEEGREVGVLEPRDVSLEHRPGPIPPSEIEQFGHSCVVEAALDFARGIADDDSVGSDVPRDNRVRADDGTVSYGDAGENRRARADPDVVSDGNTALRSNVRREFGKQLLKRVHRCICRIVIQASQDLDAARDGAKLADRDLNPFTSSGL